MGEMIDSGLVVEARFSTRKELVSELESSDFVKRVVEAKSVNDALVQLHSVNHDACLIGPNLSTPVAVDFVRRGLESVKNRDCAFVAVLSGRQSGIIPLREAGVHGILERPYSRKTFADIVRKAVDVAKEKEVSQAGTAIASTLQALSKSQYELRNVYDTAEFSFVERLSKSALGLLEVVVRINEGTLIVREDRMPSLATRDAIRLALEEAFPRESGVWTIGSPDNRFVTALVEWFTTRLTDSHDIATDRLLAKVSLLV